MSSKPVRVAIHGASGRMGMRLIQLIAEDPSWQLVAALEHSKHPSLGRDAGEAAGSRSLAVPVSTRLQNPCEVAIDFSSPFAALPFARQCRAEGIALAIGTTGFSETEAAELRTLAQGVPLIVSANFSKAVNLLMHLTAEAARTLGPAADVEIVERHHHFKKDAPSGTALRLAEVVAQQLGVGSEVYAHGRHGNVGERPSGQIGLHALRAGDNPGEHTVVFGLMGECLELSHRALNRDGFARGALDAARFLLGKSPGLYTMRDLLGFA